MLLSTTLQQFNCRIVAKARLRGHKIAVLEAVSLLCFILIVQFVSSAQASTVWVEFRTRQASFVDSPSNVTYMTSFGNYSVSKTTGAIQYTWRNGSILSPATKFIVQYLQSQDSWEDFSFAQPVFMEVNDQHIQWRQTVFNGSESFGYVVTDALFSESEPPKLSIVWDKPEVAGLTFRIMFKVTIPQAWEYFINGEDFINIPKGSELSLMRQDMRVVESPEESVLQLLVDWSDYGETEVLLKGSTVTVVFPENVREVDPSIVGTTTSSSATESRSQRKTFSHAGYDFVFYLNATGGSVKYASSNDETSWTSYDVRVNSNYGSDFSIEYDGTYIYYAFAKGDVNNALFWRRGTVNSNGTITWASEQTVISADAELVYWYPTVTMDSGGYAYIGYRFENDSDILSERPYVTKNAYNNASWSTASGYPRLLKDSLGSWRVIPLGLASSKVYVIYNKGSAYGQLFNGSGWESETQIGSSTTLGTSGCSAVALNNDVHFVADDGLVPYYFAHYRWVEGTGWSSEVIIETGVPVDCEPVVTAGSDDLFVFWNPTMMSSDDHVYFKRWTSSEGWDSTAYDWFSDSMIRTRNDISAIEDGSNGDVQLIYMQGSSPYSIKFQKMSFEETVSPFTIYNTGFDYPITNGNWDDVNLKLTFISSGGLTVDTSTYGQPFQVWDGETFLSWSLSGSNITFTASGSSIELNWMYPSETETKGIGGYEEVINETLLDVFEPVVSPLGQLGLYGLLISMGVVFVAGVAQAVSKKKVVRKPSGKGTTKKIKVKGAKNYGGITPKGVGRKKDKWD